MRAGHHQPIHQSLLVLSDIVGHLLDFRQSERILLGQRVRLPADEMAAQMQALVEQMQ